MYELKWYCVLEDDVVSYTPRCEVDRKATIAEAVFEVGTTVEVFKDGELVETIHPPGWNAMYENYARVVMQLEGLA